MVHEPHESLGMDIYCLPCLCCKSTRSFSPILDVSWTYAVYWFAVLFLVPYLLLLDEFPGWTLHLIHYFLLCESLDATSHQHSNSALPAHMFWNMLCFWNHVLVVARVVAPFWFVLSCRAALLLLLPDTQDREIFWVFPLLSWVHVSWKQNLVFLQILVNFHSLCWTRFRSQQLYCKNRESSWNFPIPYDV